MPFVLVALPLIRLAAGMRCNGGKRAICDFCSVSVFGRALGGEKRGRSAVWEIRSSVSVFMSAPSPFLSLHVSGTHFRPSLLSHERKTNAITCMDGKAIDSNLQRHRFRRSQCKNKTVDGGGGGGGGSSWPLFALMQGSATANGGQDDSQPTSAGGVSSRSASVVSAIAESIVESLRGVPPATVFPKPASSISGENRRLPVEEESSDLRRRALATPPSPIDLAS